MVLGEPAASIDQEPKSDIISSTLPNSIMMEDNRFRAVIFFEDGCGMENIRAFNVIHRIQEMDQVIQQILNRALEHGLSRIFQS